MLVHYVVLFSGIVFQVVQTGDLIASLPFRVLEVMPFAIPNRGEVPELGEHSFMDRICFAGHQRPDVLSVHLRPILNREQFQQGGHAID